MKKEMENEKLISMENYILKENILIIKSGMKNIITKMAKKYMN